MEFDAGTESLRESPKVQPGVAPNQAPAIGRRSNALSQASSMAAANLRSGAISEPEGKSGGSASPDTPFNQGMEAGWPASEATAGSDLSPVEPPADLAEILEALARSLEQEYKRYYGS